MIKAIVFDFDGVILESARVKTEAFRELFSDYPEHVEAITAYHEKNGGISRFVKFRYVYENMLGKELSKEKESELGERFSAIVLEKVIAAPFVSGVKEFLDENKGKYVFFIASGTPEKELHCIIQRRNLKEYFKEAHGSPKEKAEIIGSIKKNYAFNNNEIVYMGDALSDYKAAGQSGVKFIAKTGKRDTMFADIDCLKIKNFAALGKAIATIESEVRHAE